MDSASPLHNQIEDTVAIPSAKRAKFSKLNEVCRILGLSEINLIKQNKQRAKQIAENKVRDIITALVAELSLDGIELPNAVTDQLIQKGKDHDVLFNEIRTKFDTSSYKDKIQLLTLVPLKSSLWTLNYTTSFFSCPKYAVSKARKVKQEYGLLASPPPYKPRVHLSAEVISAVISFYKREDNILQSPNVRDRKRVKRDNKSEYVQLAFLLHPLKDLYEMFVKESLGLGFKIGFSSFANLRPLECATYSSKCIENVCVCTNHGNMEFMLSALGEGREFRHCLIETLVCDTGSFDCMIGVCKICQKIEKQARRDGFNLLVSDKLSVENFENGVRYSTWRKDKDTHRVGIAELVQPVSEYVEELYCKMLKYIPHDHITKIQASAFQDQKANHPYTTALVVADFAENYSCVVQNSIQQAYFTKTQVTVHSFVAYVKVDGEDKVISSAVISNCLDHETITVFAFQKCFIEYLLNKFPHIQHIEYWSDGSAAQYKNYKNFINIRHHKQDFGISASWNFFTTSHGKTGGDGVGANIKCSIRRESLRRINSIFIDNAEKVFNYCESKMNDWKIKPLFVSNANVIQLEAQFKLNDRFELAKKHKIPQTLKCHRIMIKHNTICAFKTSVAEEPFFELCDSTKENLSETIENVSSSQVQVFKNYQKTWNQIDYSDIRKDTWVAVSKNSSWYAAKTLEDPIEESGTIIVQLMETLGSGRTFKVPSANKRNTVCVSTSDIVCVIYPTQAGTTARAAGQLKIENTEVEAVENAMVNRNKQ